MNTRFPRFPDMPSRMRHLPVDHRGYPVPFFVAWVDGKPVFPAMDYNKLVLCIRKNLCWVCGQQLGRIKAFTIGPMCAINKTSAEPPSHLECARFSAKSCPFLSQPKMGRVPPDKYGGTGEAHAGVMIDRNPGVTLVWQTRRYEIWNDGKGGTLFDIGELHALDWYAEGRHATREEVWASIESGLRHLQEMVDRDPDPVGAQIEFENRVEAVKLLLPA